jgi:hypothetical protein
MRPVCYLYPVESRLPHGQKHGKGAPISAPTLQRDSSAAVVGTEG